jgi:hypothetical protein
VATSSIELMLHVSKFPTTLTFNCEKFGFLNNKRNELTRDELKAPDLGAAHAAVVTRKTTKPVLGEFPDMGDHILRVWPDVFGVLHPSRHLRLFIHYLLEAKPDFGKLTAKSFAQLVDCYEHVNVPMCGIVLNRDFWGIYRFEPDNSIPVEYGEGNNADLGSFEFVNEFLDKFPCPYTAALDNLAEQLGCTLQPLCDPVGAGRGSSAEGCIWYRWSQCADR